MNKSQAVNKAFKKTNIFSKSVTFIILIFLLNSWSLTSFASKDGGVERIRACNATEGFSTPGGTSYRVPLISDFDPMYKSLPDGGIQISKEMDFSPTNEFCLGQFIAIYGVVKSTITTINGVCGTGSVIPRLFPTPIQDAKDLASATKKATTTSNRNCQIALAAGVTPIITTFAQLGITYETAKQEYKNVRVCGSDLYFPDDKNFSLSQKIDGSYYKSLEDYQLEKIKSSDASYNYNDSKEYRELLHGGKEFEDKPNEGDFCRDPLRENKPQRYYMRGTRAGIFLCERYNPNYLSDSDADKKEKFKNAYECCIKRSRNFICLEKTSANSVVWNQASHIFCKAKSKCSFENNKSVIYETYKRDNDRLICAKSYSLCPYNFSVGGGTIYPDYFKDGVDNGGGFTKYNPSEEELKEEVPSLTPDPNASGGSSTSTSTPATTPQATNPCDGKSEIRDGKCNFNNKAGKLKNYCQYYRHCTIVNPIPYNINFDFISPYFSKACINFVGDSQNGINNGMSYNPGLTLGQQVNFSAPIVQCIKETMENIFYNRAGHSKCTDGSFGNLNNICKDSKGQDSYTVMPNNLIYKIGHKVNSQSMFETLQVRLKNIITAVLVLSVAFFGMKILMGKVDFQNRKELLVYIVKIGFVIYFVNGNAWKGVFFDGIYNGSNEIAKIFFKINSVDVSADKCNFGGMYADGGGAIYTPVKYPAGKSYLMIWDTLDCKIMQYLNYGPGFTASTIFLLIIASFVTGGIGLIFGVAIFILAFSLISLTIRSIHIFVSSAVAIIVYVFMTPIIAPLILFERTKSIFDAWLSHLMTFALQPIILFSYLAIFITLSEKIMYQNAVIENSKLVCERHCRSKVGNQIEFDTSKCKSALFGEIVDPLDKSVACILNFNGYSGSENNFLAFFGISGLKSVDNLLKGNEVGSVDNSNRRIMLILKSALFLYILLQFADEIPGITSTLIGESFDVKGKSGFEMLKQFREGLRSIQKRAARFAKLQAGGLGAKASKEASKEKSDGPIDTDYGGSSGSEGFTSKD